MANTLGNPTSKSSTARENEILSWNTTLTASPSIANPLLRIRKGSTTLVEFPLDATTPFTGGSVDGSATFNFASASAVAVAGVADVPDGYQVSLHAYALGVQIYQWDGAKWVFLAPAAGLYADPCYEGQIGIHYAGPTWEANDGSKVVGIRLAGCTPNRGAIPWLKLGAASNSGHGRFERVTFIQRVNTIGGTAPAEAGLFVGDEARVPYTAEYYFYLTSKP